MARSQLDSGKLPIHLNETKIALHTKLEAEVFGADCPMHDPYGSGYRGICRSVNGSTEEEVVERLWTVLSRSETDVCQNKIVQHFCAFLFNPEGLCIPPEVLQPDQPEELDITKLKFNEQLYPEKGFRQKFSGNSSGSGFSDHPPKLGFIILVHKDVRAVVQLFETIYR